MSNACKMKRIALSLDDELCILKKFDESSDVKNKKEIVGELGLPLSTLGTILKNWHEIECNALSNGFKRKKLEVREHEYGRILMEWFRQARAMHYQ